VHQTVKEPGFKLAENRDAENCFRIVELGIPANEEVTVLASPRVIEGSERKITFVSPDYTRSEEEKLSWESQFILGELGKKGIMANTGQIKDARTNLSTQALRNVRKPNIDFDSMMPRFRFRILRGHTISNLIKHRNSSLLSYAGLGAVGAILSALGAEDMRKGNKKKMRKVST